MCSHFKHNVNENNRQDIIFWTGLVIKILNMSNNEIEIGDTSVEPSHYNDFEDKISELSQDIPYEDFFQGYLLTNRPCKINKFVTEFWECRTNWLTGSKPNLFYFREYCGDAEVPVADCREREYNSQKKKMYTLHKYLDYLEEYISESHPSTKPNLYLKDWHLTRDYPNLAFYRVPKYFASDWLNEYFTSRSDLNDDYRFVYIGPKGSWTPLHADVFTSYSWSVNVVGRKRWLLFPPGEEMHLRDRFGNLAYDATAEDIFDKTNYPSCDRPGKCYDVIQEAGEAIFVPSGWHHQVWNLEDTISVNHNWVNGCNIMQIWQALSSSLLAVQKEVSDCTDMDDWHSHCQLMLRATHGLSYEEFYDLLQCIAQPRIMYIKGDCPVKMYGNWILGHNHAVWDLKQISKTLKHFLVDKNLTYLPWVGTKNPFGLLENIDNLLKTTGVIPGP